MRESKSFLRLRAKDKKRKLDSSKFVTSENTSCSETLIMKRGENVRKCGQCHLFVANLNRQLKAHTGEKSYKCNQCDFASVWASALKGHLKTHAGEKS